MARDRNTIEKRYRETNKRQKAEEKRVRRQKRKDAPDEPQVPSAEIPSEDPQ